MRNLVLILLAVSVCAQAELFKWEDAEGNIIYSDQPPPGVEKKEHQVDEKALPPIITTPALKTPEPVADDKSNQTESPERYKNISIVVPEHDTAVRQNAGNVLIKVAIEPYLFNERGDLLAIYIDDIEVARGRDLTVQLVEVDRGTHVIRAEIEDANGSVIKKASPVTFTLLRHSRLFNTN